MRVSKGAARMSEPGCAESIRGEPFVDGLIDESIFVTHVSNAISTPSATPASTVAVNLLDTHV